MYQYGCLVDDLGKVVEELTRLVKPSRPFLAFLDIYQDDFDPDLQLVTISWWLE